MKLINPVKLPAGLGLAVLGFFGMALPVSSQTLEEALDAAGVSYSVTSFDLLNGVPLPSIDWFFQDVTTHDGEDAAEASNLPAGSFTRLDATIQGPAYVSFQWKVDTDGPLEQLGFIDRHSSLSPLYGDLDWISRRVRLDCGEQQVSWYLNINEFSQGGPNAAWIDEVEIVPIPDLPELQTALDESQVDFYSDDWTEQAEAGAVNGTRARSGPVEEGFNSSMLFGVEGPVEISFDWALESDPSGFNTRMEFAKDRGTNPVSIFVGDEPGSRDLQFGPGSHCFSFTFLRDFAIDSGYTGVDEGYVDNLKITKINPSPSLAIALETAPNVYGKDWVRQTHTTHDGIDAACVSNVPAGEEERMYVELPDDAGRLSLWVKLSTEAEIGYLDVWVDGEFIGEFTGEQDWTQVEAYLEPGQDRVLWLMYSRGTGGTGNAGDSAAYIDQIEFEAGATPPGPVFQPDLSIKAPGDSYKGRNRYNKSGAKQLAKYFAKPRRPIGRFKLNCQNDCPTAPDQMRFFGTRGNRHFDVLYIVKFDGQLFNISAEFQTGQFTTQTLQSMESQRYEVRIGRKEGGRRLSQTVRVKGVSLSDPSKSDTIKARMKIRRPR